MFLMNGSGQIDRKFAAIDVMREMGWTYQQYLSRPLWFDQFYDLEAQARKAHEDAKETEQKHKRET